MSQLTPIAPAPRRSGSTQSSPPESSQHNRPNSPATAPAPAPRRRKNVSTACKHCRSRRIKCSGERPCAACATGDVECQYPSDLDGRRQERRKRRLEDLERDSDLLNQLLQTIQNSEDDHVNQVISLIRSNASLEDVKRCIKQQIVDMRMTRRRRTPELEELHVFFDEQVAHLQQASGSDAREQQPHASRRRGALDIAQLVDQPLYQVPASPWTTVTSENGLVGNLISAWFTWEKPFYNWIDEDLFLRDMQAGQLDSTFCSPFLVNALLAFACAYSDYDEAKAKQGATSSLMADFINEAKSRLTEEANEPTMTLAQGLPCLFMAVAMTGQDGLGEQYLARATSVCAELQTKYANLADGQGEQVEGQREFANALNTTCWGIFNTATMVSFAYRRLPAMEPPTRPKPDPTMEARMWTPYPVQGVSIAGYCPELLYQRCGLSLLLRDISILLFGDACTAMDPVDLDKSVLKLFGRFYDWYDDLPSHLLPHDSSPPSVLTHQANYYASILTLGISFQAGRAGPSSPAVTFAKEQCLDGALQIARICEIHQNFYGRSHTSIFLTQPIMLALLVLTDQEDMSAYRSEITDLCIFFRAMTRRFPWALAAFRMFQVSTRQRGKTLPPETEKLFEEFEKHDWENQELDRIVSLYPMIRLTDDGVKVETMSDFFDMMETLGINDKKT